MRHGLTGRLFAIALTGVPALARAAHSGAGPRYDLKRGDHLVYDQTIVRETRSQSIEQTTEGAWENHVLVLDEAAGLLRVGFQRNQTKLELSRYRENGRDRLERELPKFAALMAARPRAHAEANLVSDRGALSLPISAVRESRSEFLPFVRELLPLPASAAVSGPWDADSFGVPLRVVAEEERRGRRCLRIEGSSGAVDVRLWVCPEAGVLDGLELEGTYPQPGAAVTERITLRLRERRRGEEAAAWLRAPDTREGVLAALVAASVLPADMTSESIAPLLGGTDVGVVRRVLGVFHRLSLPPPSLDRLESLAGSADARTRALVARLLRNDSESRAKATVARLQEDQDRFVADAARVPATGEDAELRRVVAAVRGTGPVPDWRCGDLPDWPARAVRAQRSLAELPGTTLRYAPEVGPYVLRVPEDYRGDEPFPLLLYLGGGPGRGIPAAQSAEEAVAATSYLVAYPDAVGGWWDKASVERVDRLLAHLRRVLNVDPNRVYLAGPSNGGTGTLLYASLWTDRFAAAAPLMSAGLRFFDPTGGISKLGLARLPLLFVHGTNDTVLPVEGSKEAVAELRRESAKAPVELRLLEGRGHDVRLGGDDGLTLPFFAAHDREPFPREVAFETRGRDAARQRFVEVLEPGEEGPASPPGSGTVRRWTSTRAA